MNVLVCGPVARLDRVAARLRALGHRVSTTPSSTPPDPEVLAGCDAVLVVNEPDDAPLPLLLGAGALGLPVYLLHPAALPLPEGSVLPGVVHDDLTMLPLDPPGVSAPPCDALSVGVLVERSGRLLLLERARQPYAWAPPAGHVDDDATGSEAGLRTAAARELQEEVGLRALSLSLVLEATAPNPCRRGGTYHNWSVFSAEASGDLVGAQDEVRGLREVDPVELAVLAERTRLRAAGLVSDQEWRSSPGLEPVWCDLLSRLGYLQA